MSSRWLVGGLWCVSAGLAAWLWFPCPPSVIGAVIGCLLATLLATRGQRRHALACLFAWMAAATAALIMDRVAVGPFSAATAILAWSSGMSGLVAFVLVWALHKAKGTAVLILECGLFTLPWLGLLAGHRGGHLDQPVSLVEPAWAAGINVFTLFAALGLGLGTLLVLLVGSRRSSKLGARQIAVVPMVAAVCLAGLPSQSVARLNGELAQSNSPLASSEKEQADSPVAVIVFYQDFDPELGIYHFALGAGAETRTRKATELHYRVAEMMEQREPLVLGWSPQLSPATVSEEDTFARVYEVKTQVDTQASADLLDLTSTSRMDSASPFLALAQSVVAPEERDRPLRVALRIKLWMEQNRPQSPEKGGTVESCLIGARPVDQEAYTTAAQRLMDSLGLTTRLVHGFAVRADQRGESSFLLIGERDRRCWVELWLDRAGWVAIDLYPLEGPSDSNGPQNQDLQRRLGEMARSKGGEEGLASFQGLGKGALGFLLFLSIVLAGGHSIKLYRRLRVVWCAPEKVALWGYAMILDRLAEVGELRRAGETRHEFALRLKEALPSLEPLTQLHLKSFLGRPGAAPSTAGVENARSLMKACLLEWARSYSRTRRWGAWLQPFAWMQVQ